MSQFRITDSTSEILSLLQKDREKGHVCSMWQNFGLIRVLHKATLEEVNFPRKQLRVRIFGGEMREFEPTLPVYVRLTDREGAFKVECIEQNNEEMLLSLPQELVTEELRAHDRVDFGREMQREVTIQIVAQKGSSGERWQQYKVAVLNASRGGICVVLSVNNARQFPDGTELEVVSLGENELDVPIKGTTVYSQFFSYKSGQTLEKGHRVGVAFSKPLNKTLFRMLVNDVGLARLIKDAEYLARVQDVMDSTLDNIKQSKRLGKLFKKLASSSDTDRYMRVHIHLLCHTCALLCKYLDWATEHTLKRLVYCCYVHDIGLIERPKLAKVQNINELKSMARFLSDDDEKAYLNAPNYASVLAKEEGEIKDVEQILQQQRERPDGTGHPHGINHTKITPLASLFIVSHDFVDYILDSLTWSVEEFCEKMDSQYRGKHFRKVISALKEATDELE